MCGVFAYVGEEKKDLSGYLLAVLSKLEYRGYDSAGLAIFHNQKAKIIKEVGSISNLRKLLNGRIFRGSIGIAHTRWATHGGVTRKNAHPHTDCSGKIAVVHNGIIENFEKLKTGLIKKGHKFVSQTDTEVFPHLIEDTLKQIKKTDFEEVVRISFQKLEGLNAVVAVNDGKIIAARKGSPLIVGVGRDGNYLCSDIPGLISETKKIIHLKENELVSLTKSKIRIIDIKTGKVFLRKPEIIKMDETKVDKGDLDHFMLKEIYEEPEVLWRASQNSLKDVQKAVSLIKLAWGTYFSACGTAANAGLAATYLFSEIAKRHVNFAVGSEFPYFEDFLVTRSLLIVASQSGETMDTLEAVRAAKKHRSKVLALVNVPSSTLTRLAHQVIYLRAGPESAVVSTKAYVAKLALFVLFAFTLVNKYREGVNLIKKTSLEMSKMLKNGLEKKIKILARRLKNSKNIYLIGRGVNYATALEGALKIKEACYIHAEGFAGGELKHGVIALIEKGTPCIVIVANDRARNAILSNAMELKSRGGYIIGISPVNEKVFDDWLPVADVKSASPIISVIPLQLLAYHLAILKGYNPDRPRNLAKSVTVK